MVRFLVDKVGRCSYVSTRDYFNTNYSFISKRKITAECGRNQLSGVIMHTGVKMYCIRTHIPGLIACINTYMDILAPFAYTNTRTYSHCASLTLVYINCVLITRV